MPDALPKQLQEAVDAVLFGQCKDEFLAMAAERPLLIGIIAIAGEQHAALANQHGASVTADQVLNGWATEAAAQLEAAGVKDA